MLTAGADRTVRLWDTLQPCDSYRITAPPGPPLPDSTQGVVAFSGRNEGDVSIMEERVAAVAVVNDGVSGVNGVR